MSELSTQAAIEPSSVKRVLIIRPRFLGDICITLPVVDHLRRLAPQATIDYLVEEPVAPLLIGDPRLRQVIAARPSLSSARTIGLFSRLRRERFDLRPYRDHLRAGRNVLAVIGLNDRPSSDMSLVTELGTLPVVTHASFRLARSGGVILLTGPDGAIVDRLEYSRQVPDQSFGRSFSVEDELGVFLTPTPGRRNGKVNLTEPVEEATLSF